MANALPASSFNKSSVATALYASVIIFLTYTCVFAFRKPFTVATFSGTGFLGLSYQTLLILSQVIGYMVSKFYGIKLIAELKRLQRWKTSGVLLGIAWLALLGFALVPAPYGCLFLFINGFFLGFMWGVIFSYVEGRRSTDFIGTVLAVSFIFAGGFTRSVGKWLMVEQGISPYWMPFATGAVFAVPLVLFLFLLERLPPPDATDIKERTVRQPMDKKARRAFLKVFGFGVVFITLTYLLLTVMRDIRDNYMANLWGELGYGDDYAIFTKTETTTSLFILFILSLLVLIRKNFMAFRLVHIIIAFGFLLAGVSSSLYVAGQLSGAVWMQLAGIGLYLGYIPFNSIYFDRLLASFKIPGNVGFLIYIADSFGYLGSVGVMLSKEFMKTKISWVQFYSSGVVYMSIAGFVCTVVSLVYFVRKKKALGIDS